MGRPLVLNKKRVAHALDHKRRKKLYWDTSFCYCHCILNCQASKASKCLDQEKILHQQGVRTVIRQWSTLSGDIVLSPSSEAFKICMYKAPRDVVGSRCWPCFEEEFAIETSCGQRKLFLGSAAFPSVKKNVDKLI